MKLQPNPRNVGYCRGFVDAYEQGVENNPWSGEMDVYNYAQYKMGYDAGITEYCRDNHPEDEENESITSWQDIEKSLGAY